VTAPFVTKLRSPQAPIQLGAPSADTLHLRVQVLEAWDAVRIDANPAETVRDLKLRALAAIYPNSPPPKDFAVKLNGFEVLNENVALSEAGALDGSIFLIADRRRRPVQ
jgi:hypothetical protein